MVGNPLGRDLLSCLRNELRGRYAVDEVLRQALKLGCVKGSVVVEGELAGGFHARILPQRHERPALTGRCVPHSISPFYRRDCGMAPRST